MKPKARPSREFERFDALVGQVLSVPAAEMKRRIEVSATKPKPKKQKATKTKPH